MTLCDGDFNFIIRDLQLSNATLDFNYLSNLPLEGYTYILTFNVFKTIANVRHKKRKLFCLMCESTVTRASTGRNKNLNHVLNVSKIVVPTLKIN